MRQLNRLNQFARLWQHSRGAAQQTSVAEMAERCFCSERHVRTLLRQWQQSQWLDWQAQSGRGKRGTLRFLQTPEQLRSALLQQQLDGGHPQQALQLVQLAPEQLAHLLQPFMGGQWQNNAPTLRIPYYRPLDDIQPLSLDGRAEQHLARHIFAGLTRFADDRLVADLAHHWVRSDNQREWYFFLRPQLHWHSGEAIDARQLQQQLQRVLQSEDGSKLLVSVKSITLAHALCLRFELHCPDNWLPHRLASVSCLLPHPQDETLGAGPYRLSHFSPTLVRIESHGWYHLQHPLMQTIEYWITPQLFDSQLGTSCRHPVQIAIGAQHELSLLRPVSNSISLGFCYLAIQQSARLSAAQAAKLMHLIQQAEIVAQLPLEEGLITPGREMLPGWSLPCWPENRHIALPAELQLHYHLPVELDAMAHKLQELLAAHQCQLQLHFHPGKSWKNYPHLASADLIMGDRLIGDTPEFTLESWLRLDPLWPAILPAERYRQLMTNLSEIQTLEQEPARFDGLQHTFQQLMSDAVIMPLFNYRYQVSAPPGVEGIHLNSWGWFDFTRAWVPPPVMIE
ncbi:SgrR family transcriptional regulator [Winslowiella iniecta]|uniref:Peptide ABC transporter substrate-binding protein n=1 Tax=Winslowiella iniecta TaxID=1560201 RepID=A0A0L7TG59_9GAMM|nr:SgrR family transcriptional regulator [Winslowiella iniecta]KOC89932.1 peptide ABC transporter substrate-binding protein [Winslowiella iniecta]KOC94337.1 peptide ABC transporter substrate-binding protein [Winslowiella iniecta]